MIMLCALLNKQNRLTIPTSLRARRRRTFEGPQPFNCHTISSSKPKYRNRPSFFGPRNPLLGWTKDTRRVSIRSNFAQIMSPISSPYPSVGLDTRYLKCIYSTHACPDHVPPNLVRVYVPHRVPCGTCTDQHRGHLSTACDSLSNQALSRT